MAQGRDTTTQVDDKPRDERERTNSSISVTKETVRSSPEDSTLEFGRRTRERVWGVLGTDEGGRQRFAADGA